MQIVVHEILIVLRSIHTSFCPCLQTKCAWGHSDQISLPWPDEFFLVLVAWLFSECFNYLGGKCSSLEEIVLSTLDLWASRQTVFTWDGLQARLPDYSHNRLDLDTRFSGFRVPSLLRYGARLKKKKLGFSTPGWWDNRLFSSSVSPKLKSSWTKITNKTKTKYKRKENPRNPTMNTDRKKKSADWSATVEALFLDLGNER